MPAMPATDLHAAERPIAVFDSGVGGLTVLHELLVALPNEDFLYLGDTARFPYGTKSPEELRRFALEIAEHLLDAGAKLIVVACGSATAGVLATPATVASGAFVAALAEAAGGAQLAVESVPCPDLAPIIQRGFPFDERVVETVRGYVAPLRAAGVDTVILGSTHYPLVAPMLQRMLGRGVRLVTCGEGVVHEVEQALAAHGLASTRAGEGAYRFHCTDDVEAFRALGTRFLQMPLGEIELVALGEAEEVAA
jgi:glutamate racemase